MHVSKMVYITSWKEAGSYQHGDCLPHTARWRTTLVSLHPLIQIQLQYPLSTETTGKLTAEKRPVKQTPPKPFSPFQPCSCPGVAVDGEKCNFANIEGHFEKSV